MARTNNIFIDFENIHETDWDRLVGKPVTSTSILRLVSLQGRRP